MLIAVAALFVVLACAAAAPAMEPPTAKQIEQYKRDGSLARRIEFAKAIGNNKISEALLARANWRLMRALGVPAERMAPPPAWRGMPTKGSVKIAVIGISFNDYPAHNTIADINSKLFGAGDSRLFPYESLKSFYYRSSYNQLTIGGDVKGWTPMMMNRSSVDTGGDDEAQAAVREGLIKQAVNYWNAQGLDFSQYDNDNNGTIDFLIVLYTGPYTGWGEFWWAYQTGLVGDSGFSGGRKEGR
jgi:hypothetical protein